MLGLGERGSCSYQRSWRCCKGIEVQLEIEGLDCGAKAAQAEIYASSRFCDSYSQVIRSDKEETRIVGRPCYLELNCLGKLWTLLSGSHVVVRSPLDKGIVKTKHSNNWFI